MSEPAPLYEMVKHHITDGIAVGTYAPGAKLPSESELVGRFSVSRMTVNRALRELTRDGVIFRIQGVGSFVSEGHASTSLVEVRDIRDVIAERDAAYSCLVLECERISASPEIAELFSLESGVQLLHVVLVHFENGLPLQLERRYVRGDFAPQFLEQDFTTQSVYRYLHDIAPVSELEHIAEAALPDQFEQENLDLEGHQPVMRIRRRTWVGRKVVTLGYFSHPGDRYRVTVRVRPSDFDR